MKNLLKEIVYLGVGMAAKVKHETEGLAEKIVKNNELTRDEGKDTIEGLKIELRKIKQLSDEQVDSFVSQFSKKTNLVKEEVSKFVQEMLERPRKVKRKLTNKTHALGGKIASKTSMTKDQANDVLHDFIDEVLLIRLEAKKKSKEFFQKVNESGNKGKALIENLSANSEALLKEMKPHLQKAMDMVIDRLHPVDAKYVHSLEKRIEELEQREISK